MKKLSMQWEKGISPTEATELELMANESEVLLKRLESLLQDKIRVSRNEQISKESFDSPSWAFQQAYANGVQKAYEEVITLIKLRD